MPPSPPAALTSRDLTIDVPGRRLVRSLDLTLEAGTFLAILGRNGSGKSLTLHTLAGLRPAAAGNVTLFGNELSLLSRRRIAQQLALLPQQADDAFPATVFDTALSGRHPHVPRWQWESPDDRRMATQCLEQMDLLELCDRDVGTLSGGERRRVAIAQLLAQATPICLLDEPTNHLDPQHQLDVLDVFAARVRQGTTVIASLHDVNLAARYADECLLLFGNGRWIRGDVATILNPDTLSELYATPMEAVPWRDRWLFVAGETLPR